MAFYGRRNACNVHMLLTGMSFYAFVRSFLFGFLKFYIHFLWKLHNILVRFSLLSINWLAINISNVVVPFHLTGKIWPSATIIKYLLGGKWVHKTLDFCSKSFSWTTRLIIAVQSVYYLFGAVLFPRQFCDLSRGLPVPILLQSGDKNSFLGFRRRQGKILWESPFDVLII